MGSGNDMIKFADIRVLVIDDEEYMLTLMDIMLHGLGIRNILRAQDGYSAFEMLEKLDYQVPDLIICDLKMPRMDGFGFVQRLRANEKRHLARLPVIFLTANSDVTAVRKGLQLGISGFLAKPVSARLLESRIIKALTAPTIDPSVFPKAH